MNEFWRFSWVFPSFDDLRTCLTNLRCICRSWWKLHFVHFRWFIVALLFQHCPVEDKIILEPHCTKQDSKYWRREKEKLKFLEFIEDIKIYIEGVINHDNSISFVSSYIAHIRLNASKCTSLDVMGYEKTHFAISNNVQY